MKTKIQIKSVFGKVIFEFEKENNTVRDTVSEAIKSSADLSSANLSSADLRYANLSSANLRYADLSFANLSSADLSSANLSSAKNSELAIAQTRILPEGALIGWKKCKNDIIVKLQIPAKAKRSNALGRKCRAEFVKTLEIFGAKKGVSTYDNKTEYVMGKITKCNNWDEDFTNECSAGIHFFITRLEAENY